MTIMTMREESATLMRHEGFLRRVALGVLGGDEQLAEDALQETWIRTSGRTPDQPSRERSWLAVATMNTARSLRRRERSHERMRDRFADSGRRPANAADTRADIERRALLADVTDALLALPEPYHEAVRLRYVEGMRPSAIAERLGVPVETVRTRVKRGLERMRDRLDARYGSRDTWRHVLVPFVPASVLSRAGATGGSVAVGIGFSKTIAVAVGAVALVVILVLAFLGEFDGAPSSSTDVAATDDVSNDVTEFASASGLPSFEGSNARADAGAGNANAAAPRSAHLRGRVVDENGIGVAGLDVAVFCSGAPLRRVVTDEAGAFSLAFDDATTVTVIDVGEGPRTLGMTDASERHFDLGSDEVVELRVASGGTVSGRVVTDEGDPVANALVVAHEGTFVRREESAPMRETVADADGYFTLRHLGAFRLGAQAPGFVTLDGVLGDVSSGGNARDVVVKMTRSVTRAGYVVDPSGAPVAGVVLTALETTSRRGESLPSDGVRSFDATFARAVSGPDGRFEIGPLSAGRIRVEYECRGFESGGAYFDALDPSGVPTWGSSAPVDANGDIRLVIRPASAVAGRVVDRGGWPIAGARVEGRDYKRNRRGTLTDDHGYFRLVGLGSDDRHVTGKLLVEAEGHAICIREGLGFGAGSDLGNVVLEPEQILEGVVVDGSDAPIAGVLVKIEGDRLVESERSYAEAPTWEWMFDRSETRADALGAFAIEGLYEGAFVVVVEAEGRRAVRRVRSSDGAFVVRIDESTPVAPAVRGFVTDAITGDPIESFDVLWMRRHEFSARSTGTSRVGEGGFYEIEAIEPGLGYLTVEADGYALWSAPERVVNEGEHVIDAVLFPARRVEVRIVDAYGEEVVASVTVLHRGAVIPNRDMAGSSTTPMHFAQGTGFLGGVPADVVTLRVGSLLGETRDFEVDLRYEPEGPIVLVMD